MANYDKIKRWEAGDRIDAKDYERLLFVRKMVQEMRNYLRSTGSEMISRIEGIDQRAGDTLHLVYLTDPMNTAFVKAYMIDEGTALMLKDKMIELEKVLINAPGYKQNDYYRKVANNMTNYEEMNGGKKWEVEIFSEKSLLETLTILESLDLRIVSAENQILQDYILVKETEIASDTLIK